MWVPGYSAQNTPGHLPQDGITSYYSLLILPPPHTHTLILPPFTRDHFKAPALICGEHILPLFLGMISQGRCWGAPASKLEGTTVKGRLSADTGWCACSFPPILPSQTPGFTDCSQKGREISRVSIILCYSEKQPQCALSLSLFLSLPPSPLSPPPPFPPSLPSLPLCVLLLLFFLSSILHSSSHMKKYNLWRGTAKICRPANSKVFFCFLFLRRVKECCINWLNSP